MKKLPKEIYILGGVALILCLAIIIISLAGGDDSKDSTTLDTQQTTNAVELATEATAADVEAIALPDKAEYAQLLGFEPAQVDRLTDMYVLRYVFTTDTGVEYYYQQHLAANGQRLILKIDKMSEEDYNASLPAQSVAQTVEIAGREAVFADRMLYKMPPGDDPGEVITKMVEEGTAVLAESDLLREASEIQTLDWYENGCRYEIYADFMGLTVEDMTELAQYYFDNAK